MREYKKHRAVLRALNRFLDFSNPDQCYVFMPSEHEDMKKLWRRAAAICK